MRPTRRFTLPHKPVAMTQAAGLSHSDLFLFAMPKGRVILYGYVGLPIVFPSGPADSYHEGSAEFEAGFGLPLSIHPHRRLLPLMGLHGSGFDYGETPLLQSQAVTMQLYDPDSGDWVDGPWFDGGKVFAGFKLTYRAIAFYPRDVLNDVQAVIGASINLVEVVLEDVPV